MGRELTWLRRLTALMGLLALLAAAPASAVRRTREPISRGDEMTLLHTNHVPDDAVPLVLEGAHQPQRLDLAGTPRAPTEPAKAVEQLQTKVILAGKRRRRRRSRVRRPRLD